NAVQNPNQPILLPRTLVSHKVDYEAELAVIIGRAARNVKPEQALDYVLGYTVANDVSARDWQFEWGEGQFSRGKTFDTFCPLGPCMVTTDEIENPNDLSMRTRVNGELRQETNTGDMIFDIPTLISFLSGSTTLVPGTVILTGTPSGVGAAQKPPAFLKEGDRVDISIDGIGTLSNPVKEEKK
ncbi:MAG: fumarylacetoacetate hydrolase family protein, partial [Opitutales bacterium]|nr:fumarylacetoacetate hydrolase family protein [Opitutales bacterium]